jgi:hypothetical protein
VVFGTSRLWRPIEVGVVGSGSRLEDDSDSDNSFRRMSQIELPLLLGDYKLISSNANPKAGLIQVPNVVAVNSKTRNHILKKSKPVLQFLVGFCLLTLQIEDF